MRFARIAEILLLVSAGLSGCRDHASPPPTLQARWNGLFAADRTPPSPDDIRAALTSQLRSGGERFPSRETIEAFYSKRGYRPVWSDASGQLVPDARTLIDALQRAGDHGLDPKDYAADRLAAMAKEPKPERLADFDLLATTSFFRYASDLSTGRVHPDEVQSDWRTNPPEIDVALALDDALTRRELAKTIDALAPPHPGYARLNVALSNLRKIQTAGGWPSVPPGPKLKTGAKGPRVAALRARLGVSGSDVFDAALGRAVWEFQEQHGVEPDGVVSDATLTELNVPVEERIRQVELNLERWRWIPRNLGDPYVLVNIPGFELEMAKKGEPVWHTRVVAGKAFTPTPVLSDRIVAIVANPPWNVPESIAVNEMLPRLRKNPNALSKEGIQVIEGSGEKARALDPAKVDWGKVDTDHFPYQLRQEPGEKNPLGRLKFDLTNDLHVYLHDTPAGHVFEKTDRDVSHGCVRVENALELADRISDDATKTKLSEALDQSEERHITLPAKIPVHIYYWTAWADESGNLHFAQDIYGFDAPQRLALDRVTDRGGDPNLTRS